ncbi:MAG TPA: hypothetical protein PK350_09725 [Deltaproteobacteria bacterium]|nr:hypothetical protein [Deltaproteobacteria bacterium]
MDKGNRERIKETLFDTVRNQIENGKPAETKKTYHRLILTGHSREKALRLIASVLLEEMNTAMQAKSPFNEARYVKALRSLPRKDLPFHPI